MTKEEDILYDEQDEEQDLSVKKNIHADAADAQVDSLHKRYKKKKLVVHPPYQRNFVWDAKKASLLIESVLMNIPVPMVYLAANADGKTNVIDGQQRLTSLFSFIDGKFPDGSIFKLTGLKVLAKLKGLTYADLDETDQDKINEYTLRTITFTADSDPELQYEIFSRLNTGSVALNNQELRNCVYRGSFNDLIKRLASNKDFLTLIGLNAPHKRMQDVELVLRFASFYFNGYQNYKAPIRQFLNETIRKRINLDKSDKSNLEKAFKKAVANIQTLLGSNAFKRYYKGDDKNKNGRWESSKFNVSLYDVLMDSMARIDQTVLTRNRDAIYEAYIDLLSSDQEFIDSIELSTSSKQAVEKRFLKWEYVLNTVIGNDKPDMRCYTRAFKKSLYDANPTCAICGQHIVELDDSAVDHIEQYWLGGKTIPENARLTHRYCNWSRPRKENK